MNPSYLGPPRSVFRRYPLDSPVSPSAFKLSSTMLHLDITPYTSHNMEDDREMRVDEAMIPETGDREKERDRRGGFTFWIG